MAATKFLDRHPRTDCRPTFGSILEALCRPEFELMMWKDDDVGSDPMSKVIGAPLESGKDLFTKLQTSYLDNS